MNVDDIKSLKKGDIITYTKKDSHNSVTLVYEIEASERRSIGWVVITTLLYKIDLYLNKRMFMFNKIGFSLNDTEMLNAYKRDREFKRIEFIKVFK